MYKTDSLPHILPTKLIEKIYNDLLPAYGMQYDSKNKYLHCVITLYRKQIMECPSIYSYVPVGSKYWKKLYSNTYHEKVIKTLLDIGILESYDYGIKYIQFNTGAKEKKKKQIRIRYRINPDLLNVDLGSLYYLKEGQKLPDRKRTIPDQKYIPTQYQERFLHITIDEEASIWIDANARNLCKEYLYLHYTDSLPPDFVITIRELIEEGSYNIIHRSIRAAKAIGDAKDKQLFFYKDEYYLADLETFIALRTEGIKYHYKTEISKLKNFTLLSKRSDVNLRVSNDLVNFPSKLLPFLRINGQPLVQIDLSTSQFLLLANLFNVYLNEGEKRIKSMFKEKVTKGYVNRFLKIIEQYNTILPSSGIDIKEMRPNEQYPNDILHFINDVFNTDFYSYVGQLLKLPDRGLAKITLFQQLFRRRKSNDAFVKTLREHYPTVMNIMDDFKAKQGSNQNDKDPKDEDGDNNLSVFLQCIEAEIYIDRILQPLQRMNIPCFSRHDSICIPESDENQVRTFITNVFEELGFKYRDKIEKTSESIIKAFPIENQSMNNSDEEITEMIYDESECEEMEIPYQIYEALVDIEIQDDYSEVVDVNLLEDIAFYAGLSGTQTNILRDEVEMARFGIRNFQDQTNEIIEQILINKIKNYGNNRKNERIQTAKVGKAERFEA